MRKQGWGGERGRLSKHNGGKREKAKTTEII